ncbi:MAG: hypothetical protein ABIJ81_01900 [Patescibacteria group bacterium]
MVLIAFTLSVVCYAQQPPLRGLVVSDITITGDGANLLLPELRQALIDSGMEFNQRSTRYIEGDIHKYSYEGFEPWGDKLVCNIGIKDANDLYEEPDCFGNRWPKMKWFSGGDLRLSPTKIEVTTEDYKRLVVEVVKNFITKVKSKL